MNSLTIDEAADLLGVSRKTVSRAIGKGELPAFRPNSRVVRISRVDLGVFYVKRGGRCPKLGQSPAGNIITGEAISNP